MTGTCQTQSVEKRNVRSFVNILESEDVICDFAFPGVEA